MGSPRGYCVVEDVVCVAETEKALLVDLGGDQTWVPKSQVGEDSEVFQKGDEGELHVTEWWAEQNGLV